MSENLQVLEKRLLYIQKHAPLYYQEVIQKKSKV